MTLATYLQALYALFAMSISGQHSASRVLSASDADSVASVYILEELRGYYRDLHDRNWTSIVTHFYPAKVTARFAVPDDAAEWSALGLPPIEPHQIADAHGYCMPNTAIAIVGHWARVRARRCTGEVDEAWFYSNGRTLEDHPSRVRHVAHHLGESSFSFHHFSHGAAAR